MTLLSLQEETIAEKIDALHQKATAMLTENDDEPQPNTAVSIVTDYHKSHPGAPLWRSPA